MENEQITEDMPSNIALDLYLTEAAKFLKEEYKETKPLPEKLLLLEQRIAIPYAELKDILKENNYLLPEIISDDKKLKTVIDSAVNKLLIIKVNKSLDRMFGPSEKGCDLWDMEYLLTAWDLYNEKSYLAKKN